MESSAVAARPDTAAIPSPTWCILPWIHLFVGETGSLRPCCMALEDPEAVNRAEDGTPHVIYALEGIDAAWNSAFMRGLRLAMLAGGRPSACRRCFRDEDLGLRSHRLMSNAMFAGRIAEALAAGSGGGTVPPGQIRSLDIRLGNRCNLKCRMCSPVSSRATLADYAAVHGLAPDDARVQRLMGPADWVSRPEFRHNFEHLAGGIERLHFSGGEPLLVPEMVPLLEGLVERGLAPGIELHFVTNLTVLPERLFDLWSRFRRVGFLVSLDGIGRVGEFVRNPLRWPVADANLRRLDGAAGAINCDSLHVNVTVQAYTLLSLDEIVTYVADELPHFGRPKLSLLYYPAHLGIQMLPPDLKRRAAERLGRLAERIRAGWPRRWQGDEAEDLLSTIAGIIEHMNAADRADLLPEFRRWTQVMDCSRGEDVRVAIPELAPLFDATGEGEHG